MSKIFIYGSCVTRDAFEHSLHHHELLQYVARQSWVSAASSPTMLLNGKALNSKFQNRMLDGDLASNALPSIRKHADQIDLLLVDLTDERLGVHHLPDNTFITRSVELVSSKRLELLKSRPAHVKFGTDRFLELWQQSATAMAFRLSAMNLLERTLVVATPWAAVDETGTPVASHTADDIELANKCMEKMSSYAEKIGFRVSNMPIELAVSSSQHKWGVSPFHYDESAMDWIGSEAENAL